MLANLCEKEGLFTAAGKLMAKGSKGDPKRLLTLVFVAAAITTAVLSLNATVVLLTPVIFGTASRMGARPKPHVYATAHLANSASLLLPVSNLTNLLAMNASGLSFAKFAMIMALPWVVSLAIGYIVFRVRFRGDLSLKPPRGKNIDDDDVVVPKFALSVLVITLIGFVACSPLGIDTFWAALLGVVLLAGKRLIVDSEPKERDQDTEVMEFTKLGLLTVPISLVLCTCALWGVTHLIGV